MRIQNDRLSVRITNDSYAGVSFKLVQFVFKLGTEIGTFQIVDRTTETVGRFIISSHTAAFRS